MAQEVYSTRFMLGKNANLQISPDVPPGYLWVVRDISVYWGGLVGASGVFALGNSGFFSYYFNPTTPLSAHWDGRAVLYEGEHIDMSGSLDGVDFVVSGYELSLP